MKFPFKWVPTYPKYCWILSSIKWIDELIVLKSFCVLFFVENYDCCQRFYLVVALTIDLHWTKFFGFSFGILIWLNFFFFFSLFTFHFIAAYSHRSFSLFTVFYGANTELAHFFFVNIHQQQLQCIIYIVLLCFAPSSHANAATPIYGTIKKKKMNEK